MFTVSTLIFDRFFWVQKEIYFPIEQTCKEIFLTMNKDLKLKKKQKLDLENEKFLNNYVFSGCNWH
jgi:hypothetical protein